MKTLFSIVALFAAFSSQASGTWIQNTKVTDVRWYDHNGGHGYITTENNSNPECPNAKTGTHRYFSNTGNNTQSIISLGLSAMLSDKTVNILVEGCHDSLHSKVKGIVINR
ncbi:hypothetical protein JF50_02030 [Pseudoalteromonas luteoviolacea]|uniref:Pectate lyase n=1 Tax=Pseudoalteromonas luteoviolacea TaxID=43657 RepID=A0A0C1QUQ4_9GAMM|nr:hypothetical protein [Pseudoalteromonas luteoviolacea]KID58672.1 hypothetical protein JF50_02030 [Pseudoalteromonas luteoviolacea]